MRSSLRWTRPSACSYGCNLSFSVSVPPGADTGRRSERSGNSMLFFQGFVSSLLLACALFLLFFSSFLSHF